MNVHLAPEQAALRLTRHYPFPRHVVFDAWTTPAALKAWFAPSEKFEVPLVEVDLRVGGRYRIVMVKPGGERHEGGGLYTEVYAPSRLAFTWQWTFTTAGESLVTIDFREAGDGGTELVLTHDRLSEAVRASHQAGWIRSLERLDNRLKSQGTK